MQLWQNLGQLFTEDWRLGNSAVDCGHLWGQGRKFSEWPGSSASWLKASLLRNLDPVLHCHHWRLPLNCPCLKSLHLWEPAFFYGQCHLQSAFGLLVGYYSHQADSRSHSLTEKSWCHWHGEHSTRPVAGPHPGDQPGSRSWLHPFKASLGVSVFFIYEVRVIIWLLGAVHISNSWCGMAAP